MMQVAMWSGVCLVTTRHRWQGVLLAACGAVLLATNLYLGATVAMKPPTQGEMAGSLPATLRQFGHVYYADRAGVYGQFEAGRMDLDIYPTAMFLRKETQRQSPR